MQNYNNSSNKKSSSRYKTNNDLSDNSTSFEAKNDKDEKDLDGIVYLEESDIIESRKQAKNIKNRDIPPFESKNSGHIKAKSNYNYFESRYTKKIRMIILLKNQLIEERKAKLLYSMIKMKTVMKKLKVIILVKEFLMYLKKV